MTDPATKAPRIETCRWSLTLGIGLLLASIAAAGVMIPRLAGKGPLRRLDNPAAPVAEPLRPSLPENGGIATEIRAEAPK